MTHNLTYIGPDPQGTPPLPEGWPAANHYEADSLVYSAKLMSGMYRQWTSSDQDAPQYGPGPDFEGDELSDFWRELLRTLAQDQAKRAQGAQGAQGVPETPGAGDSSKNES